MLIWRFSGTSNFSATFIIPAFSIDGMSYPVEVPIFTEFCTPPPRYIVPEFIRVEPPCNLIPSLLFPSTFIVPLLSTVEFKLAKIPIELSPWTVIVPDL